MSEQGNHAETNQSLETPRVLTVGAEIREVRKARGLTLEQLSELTGRSVANISRIERGETTVTIDSLNDIGTALQVNPKWFFPSRLGIGDFERSYVVRSQVRRPMSEMYVRSTNELGFSDELLSSSLTGQFYMTSTVFPPEDTGKLSLPEEYVFEGEQHGVIIQGELDLYLGDEKIRLNKRDSFSYPSTVPHRFTNPGKQDAIMIWAASPVRINW